MQHIIDRLKKMKDDLPENGINLIVVDEELSAIINQLETLDQDHTRQTDELRGHRETLEEIRMSVVQARRRHNIWQDEIRSQGDDVAYLLTDLGDRLSTATDDAAAMRGSLETVLSTTHRRTYENGEPIRTGMILEWVRAEAEKALGDSASGVALRQDIRRLQAMVKEFEEAARNNGNHYSYNDPTLHSRVQRVVDHYTRQAATTVSNARAFKDDILTWLRAMAINAESVSWAGTHQEKNARLRGLVEVIEQACKKVNELRVEERYSWDDNLGNWMRSDFPVREFKRRIYELEDENKRLKAAQAAPQTESATPDDLE